MPVHLPPRLAHDDGAMPGDHMSNALREALDQACRRHGDAVALSDTCIALSYRQLAEQAHALAAQLRAAGLLVDEPVHVQVSNRPFDLVALLGVWLAGGVAVPVHRSTPPAVAAGFQQRTRSRWRVDLQADRVDADALTAIAAEAPPPRALLSGAALIVFTSGSTGVPKGVVVAHAAFAGKIAQIDSLLHFGPAERTLLVLNITFSFGLWVSLLTLLRGGTLLMQARFEPDAFLRTLVDERITRVGMVPTMMRVLFAQAAHGEAIDRVRHGGHLRQILIGGELLGHSLAETIRQRFATTALIDIYGLTETATCDFFSFPADYAQFPGSIGRPSPNVQYRIAGADGRPVDAGALGELQIRSPYLMRGYLDAPELTAAAFQDGWFRTGDVARVVDAQVVELMGRQKEVINRGGNKVTPVEIEQAVCAHADVAAAMAVGIADPLLGERIHLLLVPRTGATLDLAALRRHLEAHLERFKHPDVWYLAEALPLGRTGKADRMQLRAAIVAGEIAPIAV